MLLETMQKDFCFAAIIENEVIFFSPSFCRHICRHIKIGTIADFGADAIFNVPGNEYLTAATKGWPIDKSRVSLCMHTCNNIHHIITHYYCCQRFHIPK